MTDQIPTGLIISGKIREAGREGIAVTVRQKGDETSGTIILKINLLDGTSRVFSQVRVEDRLAWMSLGQKDLMSEEAAEKIIHSQQEMDPDVWVVEIEDKKGRLWFEGKIISRAY